MSEQVNLSDASLKYMTRSELENRLEILEYLYKKFRVKFDDISLGEHRKHIDQCVADMEAIRVEQSDIASLLAGPKGLLPWEIS